MSKKSPAKEENEKKEMKRKMKSARVKKISEWRIEEKMNLSMTAKEILP